MHCKHCAGFSYVKAGIHKGNQRYKCRDCGRHFTNTPPRGKPESIKLLAVLLYASRVSQLRIAQILGVSNVVVMKWIHAYADKLGGLPAFEGDALIVEIDEMHHFLQKKTENSGYGNASILLRVTSLTGRQAAEMPQP